MAVFKKTHFYLIASETICLFISGWEFKTGYLFSFKPFLHILLHNPLSFQSLSFSLFLSFCFSFFSLKIKQKRREHPMHNSDSQQSKAKQLQILVQHRQEHQTITIQYDHTSQLNVNYPATDMKYILLRHSETETQQYWGNANVLNVAELLNVVVQTMLRDEHLANEDNL